MEQNGTVATICTQWNCVHILENGFRNNIDIIFLPALRQAALIELINNIKIYIDRRSKYRAGAAHYGLRAIKLHQCLFDENDPVYADRFDTLFHEISHHVAFFGSGERGHGFHWKQAMIAFGYQPKRLYDPKQTDYAGYKERVIDNIAAQIPDFEV